MDILLVEDSQTAQLLVRTLLAEESDVNLECVGTMADALKRLGERVFDLVLLDLTLPDSSGLSSVQRVKGFAGEAPIVVLTAVSDEVLGVKALQSGAQDYLIKDETYKKLLRRSIRYAIERNRSEKALREAMRKAEAATTAKSRYIAHLSHELRTPLTAIIGFSEMMNNEVLGPVGNERYKGYLHDIHSSAHHLLRLMSDVLDLSRIEAGRFELSEERCRLAEVVEFAFSVVRDSAAAKGIAVALDVDPSLVLRADQLRLRQVFLNLIGNAIKFSDAGGEVTARSTRDDGWVVVSIADKGRGMDPAQIPLALAEFGRVREDGAPRAEGAGLGLPLASELVRLHGGSLDIDSRLGEGTVVHVRLPAERLVAG